MIGSSKDKELAKVEALKKKKIAMVSKIVELRKRKSEINKILDDCFGDRNSDHGKSPLKLINELYSINIDINNLRDEVDKINKKLQTRENLIHPVWKDGYLD